MSSCFSSILVYIELAGCYSLSPHLSQYATVLCESLIKAYAQLQVLYFRDTHVLLSLLSNNALKCL